MRALYARVAELLAAGRAFKLARLVETRGSAPRPGSTKRECAGSPSSNDGMTRELSGFSFATPGAMSLSSRGFSAQTIAARFTQDL